MLGSLSVAVLLCPVLSPHTPYVSITFRYLGTSVQLSRPLTAPVCRCYGRPWSSHDRTGHCIQRFPRSPPPARVQWSSRSPAQTLRPAPPPGCTPPLCTGFCTVFMPPSYRSPAPCARVSVSALRFVQRAHETNRAPGEVFQKILSALRPALIPPHGAFVPAIVPTVSVLRRSPVQNQLVYLFRSVSVQVRPCFCAPCAESVPIARRSLCIILTLSSVRKSRSDLRVCHHSPTRPSLGSSQHGATSGAHAPHKAPDAIPGNPAP